MKVSPMRTSTCVSDIFVIWLKLVVSKHHCHLFVCFLFYFFLVFHLLSFLNQRLTVWWEKTKMLFAQPSRRTYANPNWNLGLLRYSHSMNNILAAWERKGKRRLSAIISLEMHKMYETEREREREREREKTRRNDYVCISDPHWLLDWLCSHGATGHFGQLRAVGPAQTGVNPSGRTHCSIARTLSSAYIYIYIYREREKEIYGLRVWDLSQMYIYIYDVF